MWTHFHASAGVCVFGYRSYWKFKPTECKLGGKCAGIFKNDSYTNVQSKIK